MSECVVNQFRSICEQKGYAFFERGDFNLNLFGIRRVAQPNKFDDFFAIIYKVGGKWVYRWFWATTDAGQFYLDNPIVEKGCALLKEGQYRGAYAIGLHKGQYEALRQVKPVSVFRDNNRDSVLDLNGEVDTGIFGINIHRGSLVHDLGYDVDKWSAGCQVIADSRDFEELMNLCRKSAKIFGNSFTYTLLNENDFKHGV